jgi:hypothetical protein
LNTNTCSRMFWEHLVICSRAGLMSVGACAVEQGHLTLWVAQINGLKVCIVRPYGSSTLSALLQFLVCKAAICTAAGLLVECTTIRKAFACSGLMASDNQLRAIVFCKPFFLCFSCTVAVLRCCMFEHQQMFKERSGNTSLYTPAQASCQWERALWSKAT